MLQGIKAAQPDRLLSTPMRIAVALTMAYLGAMLLLYSFPPPGVFEPKLLLPILNTIFAGTLPLAVSFIAIRLYLARSAVFGGELGGGGAEEHFFY
jgi:hypothetical protein